MKLMLIIFLSQVWWISRWSELSFSLLLHFQSISRSDISHLRFLGEHFEWTLFKNNIRIEEKYLFLRTISNLSCSVAPLEILGASHILIFFKNYCHVLVYLKLIYIKALSNIYFYHEKLFEKEIVIIYAGEEWTGWKFI